MRKLLIKMRDVPEDEAHDLRNLLKDNHIDFYETTAGNWGISMPALWLNDESQLDAARKLVHDYQAERYQSARDEYEKGRIMGSNQTVYDVFLSNPVRFTLYLLGVIVILYLSVKPFIDFGETP